MHHNPELVELVQASVLASLQQLMRNRERNDEPEVCQPNPVPQHQQQLTPTKILEDTEHRATSERDLVKRLCVLLRPTIVDMFPPLLRLTLVNPGEVVSSPQLRLRVISAVKRFQDEHAPLHTFLQGVAGPVTGTTMGVSGLAEDMALLAAEMLAKNVGRWALLGRADIYRAKKLIATRINSSDLSTMLSQLGEDWLLGDHEQNALSTATAPTPTPPPRLLGQKESREGTSLR